LSSAHYLDTSVGKCAVSCGYDWNHCTDLSRDIGKKKGKRQGVPVMTHQIPPPEHLFTHTHTHTHTHRDDSHVESPAEIHS